MVALLKALVGLALILAIIPFLRYCYNKGSIKVKSVKAGPTQSHSSFCVEDYQIGPFDTFYHKGKKINPQNYIVARVDGDCMSARGVYPGNLIFIQRLTDDDKKKLCKGDILYIKYERDGFSGYKIREFENVNDADSINTIYYTAENKTRASRLPHKLSNVEGVVRYNFKL